MKLVDMNDSKSFGLYHVGSSPTSGTIEIIADTAVLAFFYKYVLYNNTSHLINWPIELDNFYIFIITSYDSDFCRFLV